MHSLFTFTTPPHPCSYLPWQQARLEYEVIADLSGDEYLRRMLEGWRRFGRTMFHPVCRACQACQALRVRVADFRPDRSQKRCRLANQSHYRLEIGAPRASLEKLQLYGEFHAFQSRHKGWPEHDAPSLKNYESSFVEQPFTVEEWCYYNAQHLVGVGYVDALPDALPGDEGQEGLSLIYFYYDPGERSHGLGTWNVLAAIEEAARRGLPYVYLGYFVAGCGSLEYKARFRPNEVRGEEGTWRSLRD